MNPKIFLFIIILILIAVGIYFLVLKSDSKEMIYEQITDEVKVQVVDPIKNLPLVNPFEEVQINSFEEIKVNPFK